MRNASAACPSSHIVCRVTREARGGPSNLHGRDRERCLQGGEAPLRPAETGRSSAVAAEGCEGEGDGRKDKAAVRRGGVRLTGHQRASCRPFQLCLNFEKTYSQRSPSTCPFCPNFLGEILRDGLAGEEFQDPVSTLLISPAWVRSEGGAPLREQCPVPATSFPRSLGSYAGPEATTYVI